MTFVAVGPAIPQTGLATTMSLAPGKWQPELKRQSFCIDPLRLRRWQPSRIPVDWEHGHDILGEIVGLELRHGALWAIAELHDEAPTTDTALYWSVSANWKRDGSDVVVDRIAVTPEPAMLCASPLMFFDGPLSEHLLRSWTGARHVHELLRSALQERKGSAPDAPTQVRAATLADREALDASEHAVDLSERAAEARAVAERPPGKLRHGPRGRILSVH